MLNFISTTLACVNEILYLLVVIYCVTETYKTGWGCGGEGGGRVSSYFLSESFCRNAGLGLHGLDQG